MATLPERSTAVLLYWARSAAAIKRSWARWTFAEAVIGISSTIRQARGTLNGESRSRQCRSSSPGSSATAGRCAKLAPLQEVGHGSAEGVALGAGAFEGFQDFEP